MRNKDVLYVGIIIILVLAVVFEINMFYQIRKNYINVKETCDSKINFVATHFTNISSIYNYTNAVVKYSKYLESKDKNPCNCTKYKTDYPKIVIQDNTHISLERDVYCTDKNEKYKEIISFNYLAPILKNWTTYAPSEFCIVLG